MPTIRDLRRQAHTLPTPTPLLDIECLLASILGVPRSYLLSHDDTVLTSMQYEKFKRALDKRRSGLPVAYITGIKEFYGLDFFVTPRVLIPKPDTELLVECALSFLDTRSHSPNFGAERPLEVADLCTGSGCVAIAVLANTGFPIRFTATDISEAALEIARSNACRLLPPEKNAALTFVHTSLMEGILGKFDLILANPPYVPTKTTHVLLNDGRGEPLIALDGGEDGLDCIRPLIAQAAERLAPGGQLLLECGEYNIEEAAALCRTSHLTDCRIFTDAAGMPRVLAAQAESLDES
jgi:release factor glutamine methyltransferase